MRMRRTAIGLAVVATSFGILVGLAAGQAAQPRPGPGSGVIPVEGTVTITNIPAVTVSNMPTVHAVQGGDWKVAVHALPAVRLAAPSFLREGRAYRFTWPSGQQEELTVKTIADGWVFVDRLEGGAHAARWVNPAMVVTIDPR